MVCDAVFRNNDTYGNLQLRSQRKTYVWLEGLKRYLETSLEDAGPMLPLEFYIREEPEGRIFE